MPAKHRCNCFTETSSSFLIGLRREAPSTERVLLERLLNVLSRAAANKTSSNPQKLWAFSEMPEWWTQVTKLPWKNPREHPKDNKDTLKKKIDILEKELTKRNMMSQELREELDVHKEGKKADLELKSDFEAVIAKASGLHFMINKVNTKMGDSRVLSDKISNYIKETKSCLEKCLAAISRMYKQVEDRERKRMSMWEKMGVSMEQRDETAALKSQLSDLNVDDLQTDCLDLDLEDPSSEMVAAFGMDYASAPLPTSSFYAAHPSPATEDQQDTLHTALMLGNLSRPQDQLLAGHMYLTSVSQASSPSQLPLQAMTLSPGAPSASYSQATELSQKNIRRLSGSDQNETERAPVQMVPRGGSVMTTVIEDVIGPDCEIIEHTIHSPTVDAPNPFSGQSFPGAVRSSDRRTPDSEVQLRKDRKQRDRTKSAGPRQVRPQPTATNVRSRSSDSSIGQGLQKPGGPLYFKHEAERPRPGRMKSPGSRLSRDSPALSVGLSPRHSDLASDDLAEDGGSPAYVAMDVGGTLNDNDLENVTDIIEESESQPTVSMYTGGDARDMDALAARMTARCSCEDLVTMSPSVVESVMTGSTRLSSAIPQQAGQYPASRTSSATAQQPDHTLSQAIGGLTEMFSSHR